MTSTQYLREQPTETEAPAPSPEPHRERSGFPGVDYSARREPVSPDWPQALPVVLRWEARRPPVTTDARNTYLSLYGEHQAGILTPVQDRLHFAAFDVITNSRAELVQLLKDWTAAAARMTQGLGAGEVGPTSGPYGAPPDDTGEAIGLPPAGLTITFGFGPTLFRAEGKSRFGLGRQPAALQRLPHFPADKLDPLRSDGDLCVQAVLTTRKSPCMPFATSPGSPSAGLLCGGHSWALAGLIDFDQPGDATEPDGLQGRHHERQGRGPAAVDEHVCASRCRQQGELAGRWLVSGGAPHQHDHRDLGPPAAERAGAGHWPDKGRGAPLTGGGEFSQPDFNLIGSDQEPIVATDAHVRLVHPSNNAGAKMLRRGYNFVDGSDGLGRMDAGLFFLAYVRDPRTQFIPIQTKLGLGDGLSEYVHTPARPSSRSRQASPRASTSARRCSPKARASPPQRSRFRHDSWNGSLGLNPVPGPHPSDALPNQAPGSALPTRCRSSPADDLAASPARLPGRGPTIVKAVDAQPPRQGGCHNLMAELVAVQPIREPQAGILRDRILSKSITTTPCRSASVRMMPFSLVTRSRKVLPSGLIAARSGTVKVSTMRPGGAPRRR